MVAYLIWFNLITIAYRSYNIIGKVVWDIQWDSWDKISFSIKIFKDIEVFNYGFDMERARGFKPLFSDFFQWYFWCFIQFRTWLQTSQMLLSLTVIFCSWSFKKWKSNIDIKIQTGIFFVPSNLWGKWMMLN